MTPSLVAQVLRHCALEGIIALNSSVVSNPRRVCSIADQPDLALLGLCLMGRIVAPFVIAALAQANRNAQAELTAEAAMGRQRRPALLLAVPDLEAPEIVDIEEHASLRPLAV